MNLKDRYKLAEGVAIRPERFGGLVYHYHNRQLYFLHSHELADFVRGLTGGHSLAEALAAFRDSRGLSADVADAMLKPLTALENMGLVVRADRSPGS